MPALDQINQGGTIYEIVPEIAELFKTTKAYHTGDHVIYEAGWYTFKADKSAGAWDATKVDGPFKVTEQISNLKEDLSEYESIFTGNVDESVQNWLDNHPEATTSVPDNSLTYKKLVNGTLGFVFPEMYGAVGDGVTDDTEAIQQAVDSDAKLVIFSKQYLVVENNDLEFKPAIELASNKTYMFVGDSKIILKATSNENYAILSIIDQTNITIINPSIIGDRDDHAGSLGEWGFGIFIKDSDNINIFNAKIYKTWGDGIYIRSSQNIYVDYVYVEKCSRIGVSFTGAKNVYIGCVEGIDIDRVSPKSCVDIEMDFPNETWDNIVIDNIISTGCNNAFSLLPAHSSESTGNDYNVDVRINKILSNGGTVYIRSFVNANYNGVIHIGNINIFNIKRNSTPVSIYSSSQNIKTVIDKITVDDCNVGDTCAVLVFNENNSDGVCNLTITDCIITKDVVAKYSVRTAAKISDNVNIKLSAFLPVWVPHYAGISTNKYINWKGSEIVVYVSECVNYTDKADEFLATTYINDKDSDTLLSVHGYFGLMGVSVKLIGLNDYVCGFYMESDITGLYPASKNFTRRDVKVSAYGEISEFILLEENKVIITKLPTTI